jgi:probable F420-dependent oxidoreductase
MPYNPPKQVMVMKFVLSSSFCDLAALPELAQAADRSGWCGMSFSDHVVHPETLKTPYPYTETGERRWEAFTQWPDPIVMIGALAMVTKNLRFMNNILVLPMRNPFLAAKSIATAAVLSDNRINLCIGVGWCKDEFELLQQDFHTRGRRCDEMVEVMRKLWQGGWVEHDGPFYPFERLEMTPAPSEPVPIWVGGISDAALKRAARLGDGWVSDLQSSADIEAAIKKIHEYRKVYGRDHLPFDVMATPNDAFMPDQYAELREKGVTHIMTQPWFFYHQAPFDTDKQVDAIARYAEDVIRPLNH